MEKGAVSDICEEFNLQPSVFHRWLREFFENGTAAFEQASKGSKKHETKQQRRIEKLEERIQKKNEVLAELMEEHVILKKVLGRFSAAMGSSRHSGSDRRFRAALEREDRNSGVPVCRMAANRGQQVLRLEGALRESQRAQQLDSARSLAGRLGKEGHHRLSSRESIRGVSAADIHDVGSRCCGRQSFQRLEGVGPGRPLTAMESETVAERHGIPTAVKTPPTLAHRCVLYQHCGHVLLLVQRPGRRQPLHRALGDPGIDEGIRGGDHSGTAREKFPDAKPRVISDNGPQFIAKDFKEFIRICGMTHVKTSPYYPQSNGKIERWHKSIKTECIRPGVPLSLEDAQRIVGLWVKHYNSVRLHSAIGYLAPLDKLEGRAALIFAERDRKLEEARQLRQQRRNRKTAGTGLEPRATVD